MFPTSLLINAFGQLQGKADTAAATDVDALLQRLVDIDTDPTQDPSQGFAAELQGIFAQLPAPVLQELKALIERGNDLPQAAKGILDSRSDGPQRHPFANLMQPRQADGSKLPGAEGMPEARLKAHDNAPATVSTAAPVSSPLPTPEPATRPMPIPPGMVEPGGDPATGPGGGPTRAPGQSGGTMMSSTIASSLLQMGVPEPVGGRAWPAAVADRVLWMVQGEQQVAKLKLNPPNLGPLEVRLTLQNDQASVVFSAQHAPVRDALEAALPRLRELMEQQSLQLVQADVNDPGARREGTPDGAGHHHATASGHMDDEAAASPLPTARVAQGNGLVDLFA